MNDWKFSQPMNGVPRRVKWRPELGEGSAERRRNAIGKEKQERRSLRRKPLDGKSMEKKSVRLDRKPLGRMDRIGSGGSVRERRARRLQGAGVEE